MTIISVDLEARRKNKDLPTYIDTDFAFPLFEEFELEAISPSDFSEYTGIKPELLSQLVSAGEVPSLAIQGMTLIVRPKFDIALTCDPVTRAGGVALVPMMTRKVKHD